MVFIMFTLSVWVSGNGEVELQQKARVSLWRILLVILQVPRIFNFHILWLLKENEQILQSWFVQTALQSVGSLNFNTKHSLYGPKHK